MSSKERDTIHKDTEMLDSSKHEIVENIETISDEPNYQNYKNTIYKSEGVTLVLSTILGLLGFNGTGHIYLGKIRRGIALLVGSLGILVAMVGSLAIVDVLWSSELVLAVFGISFIGYIALFVYQIIDARRLCKEYNKAVYETGIAPW